MTLRPGPHRSWLAVATLAVVGSVAACSGGSSSGGAGGESGATTLAGGATCASRPTVRVSAPADVKDVVADQAATLEGSVCATYVVTAEAPAAVAQRGATKDGGPDLWISDTPIWPQQVNVAKPGSLDVYSQAMATSPVALAVPSAIVAQGKVPTGQRPMAEQIAGALPALQLADLHQSSATQILLLTAWTNTGTDRAAQLAAARAFVPVAKTTATDTQLYERAVPGAAQGPAVFPASEQGMAAFNAKHPDAKLTSLGAVEGLAALKYVAARPAGLDEPVRQGADALEAALRGPKAAEALRAAGFRVGGTGTASVPGMPQNVTISLDAPSPATVQQVLALLTNLGMRARMLLVVDTSGSMLDPSGYGGTRIELAARSVATGLNAVPANTEVSLWQMASNLQFGATDYKVLLPMTKISGDDGNLLPAALQLRNAFDAIRPVGGTGLYDTVSDAYESTVRTAAKDVNSIVVVVTDGRNEDDPDSISLETLASRITSQRSAEHPVRLVMAGMGPGADMPALRAIAAAAGGTATLVDSETSLVDVIVAAMLPTP